MPATRPPEFRRRAVELARLREQPIAKIAKDLGISESRLRRWLDYARRARAEAVGFGAPFRAHHPVVRPERARRAAPG